MAKEKRGNPASSPLKSRLKERVWMLAAAVSLAGCLAAGAGHCEQ